MSFHLLRLLASKMAAPRLPSSIPQMFLSGRQRGPSVVSPTLRLANHDHHQHPVAVLSPPTPPFATTTISSFAWESLVNLSVWFIKRTFQPSLMKRKRRMGFLVRQRTVGGRNVLKRRRAKGRRRLDGGI